ncbi:MAG TPA: signal peptidase I [Enterococcus sp.]|nr:signal peptidase I [Enterococcus sp.]
MKKIVYTLGNIFATIIVAIVLIFVVLNYLSAPNGKGLFGYKGYTVLSNSMKGTFEAGDYIIDQVTPYDELQVGEVISYLHDNNTIVTHRIATITEEGIMVKGDTNPNTDDVLITKDNYIGQYLYHIPKLGYLSAQLSNPIILISICFAIAILLLVLYFKK